MPHKLSIISVVKMRYHLFLNAKKIMKHLLERYTVHRLSKITCLLRLEIKKTFVSIWYDHHLIVWIGLIVLFPWQPLGQHLHVLNKYFYMTCREFGFEHMLIDLMEAPPSVLTYFCTYHHLHNIPVADNMTVGQITAFTSRHSNIQTFFTKDQVVS